MTIRPVPVERLRLIAITQIRAQTRPIEDVVAELAAGGITALMLREKDLLPRDLYQIALACRVVCQATGILLIVNHSIEVALAAGADGVHLGEASLPTPEARRIVGNDMLIGYSAHDEMEVERAAHVGIDYCTVSPVLNPMSKEASNPPIGFGGLRRLVDRASVPVVALGGLEASDVADCITAGAVGVAAIGSLYGAADPRAAAHQFRVEVNRAHG